MRKVWFSIVLGCLVYPAAYGFEVSYEEPSDIIIYSDGGASADNSSNNQTNDYMQLSYNDQKKHYKNKKGKRASESVATKRPATGRRVFIFNPNTLRWAVYERDGTLVRTGHGSAGRHYCPDIRRGCKTPSGTYSIHAKMGPGFRSSRYPLPGGGAPMPWAMFFSKYYAIHGSNDVPGYNASHGCVRVYPSDARWLNTQFLNYGSTVIIRPY